MTINRCDEYGIAPVDVLGIQHRPKLGWQQMTEQRSGVRLEQAREERSGPDLRYLGHKALTPDSSAEEVSVVEMWRRAGEI